MTPAAPDNSAASLIEDASLGLGAAWAVPPDVTLKWRVWGDETVVFHCQSGDTHLLEAPAAEVLRYLEGPPRTSRTPGQIAQHLADWLNEPTDADILQFVQQLLRNMDELGLVEPTDETA